MKYTLVVSYITIHKFEKGINLLLDKSNYLDPTLGKLARVSFSFSGCAKSVKCSTTKLFVLYTINSCVLLMCVFISKQPINEREAAVLRVAQSDH